jgi:hypothetical protein
MAPFSNFLGDNTLFQADDFNDLFDSVAEEKQNQAKAYVDLAVRVVLRCESIVCSLLYTDCPLTSMFPLPLMFPFVELQLKRARINEEDDGEIDDDTSFPEASVQSDDDDDGDDYGANVGNDDDDTEDIGVFAEVDGDTV